MSELDPGATAPPVAAPAAAPAAGGLVLAPPAPVQVIKEEQVAGAVPVAPEKQTELQQRANAFATELASMDHRTPQFSQKVDTITAMGGKELQASANVSNRMLDRPAAVIKANKGGGGGDAQTRVATSLNEPRNTVTDLDPNRADLTGAKKILKWIPGGDKIQKYFQKYESAQTRVATSLNELRNTVTDLDPNRADLTGAKKILKWIPGGDKIQKYFQKYESAQTQLNAIIKSLDSGQDDLRKDNAAIETEKQNMWTTMGKLSEYNELASALDDAIAQKVAELEAAGNTEAANTLKSDALFAIRQRRQDIMTQMAVSVQGYMALDLVRKNNIELIKGVERAKTTTVSALRTAVIVSQALARQKLVLDQISALNTTTSNLIESTSQQLKVQGGQINEQAASSTIDVQKLQAAFDNVFATMDAIDTFRGQAVDSMAQTVTALEGQIDRAKPYLARTRQQEGNTADFGAANPNQLPPA